MTKLKKLANNFHVLECGGLTIWFSYETPIALKNKEDIIILTLNEWGTTTGRHINAVKREGDFTQMRKTDFDYVMNRTLLGIAS